MDAQTAMMGKHQAAWKDVQAQLDRAKKARGEKKVAALKAAPSKKLVTVDESMQKEMGGSPLIGGSIIKGGSRRVR